ncbi:EAL domain-containing protein [Aureimonas psammosilenae]|uniref:EAL domain-containing protein n=1 Tax=Aureimonas psammosilenae TaxID=2495496 RepID=UPI0012610EBC|nr:EAL domain-containing protein [Aureimonas psammosilenae]
MTSILPQFAASHSLGFVLTALTICVVAGWLLAALLKASRNVKPAYRRYWMAGTALVAGLGVWTTHFIAMLGYRPDLLLGYDGEETAASALIAILIVGVPLALSAPVVSWRRRAALGALSGFGIGAMHYSGMRAVEGCLQTNSPTAALLAFAIGICALSAARGVSVFARSRLATCALFTIGVCGMHFTAIAGTVLTLQEQAGIRTGQNVVLSVFTGVGAAVLFLGAFATILTAKRFEAQERAHSAILRTSLDNMSNGLIFFDAEGRLGLFNRRFLEMCNLSEEALSVGQSREDLLGAIAQSMAWSQDRRALVGARFDHWVTMDDGETDEYSTSDGRILEVNSCLVDDGVVLTFDDVTKDRQAQRRIEELAFIDPLTKLPNRRALQQRMEEDFHPKQRFKLLLLDLDRFKAVNDSHGHGVGDKLLVQVADRIRTIVGPDGFAARLGGDELAVLVYGDMDLSMAIADRIVEAVSRAFRIDGINVGVGCSIGMCCTDDARDTTELMQRSDVALYESKRNGRGRASCYKPGMLEAVMQRQTIEVDMRTAVSRGEFYLVYQPVLALGEDRVIGYEALIRWEHPVRGLVSPAEFIPIAEETGQIVEIGRWVLEEACREAATWDNGLYVAVNVSAVQFRSPLLLSHLTGALVQSGLPAKRLEIELTETAIVEDGQQIAHALANMRALGVKIAMDDFGTGYSSLAHLRDLPFDRIKVDRSFVMTAETDRHSAAVLRGITHIARELEIAILAEGVETEGQLAFLRSIGCDAVQGYLVGRPERLRKDTEIAIAASA